MQKRRICRENSKYAPDESFSAVFAVAERLPTSATLISDYLVFNFIIIIQKPADTVKTREQFSFHCHLDDEI